MQLAPFITGEIKVAGGYNGVSLQHSQGEFEQTTYYHVKIIFIKTPGKQPGIFFNLH